jgi:hypothetical protein
MAMRADLVVVSCADRAPIEGRVGWIGTDKEISIEEDFLAVVVFADKSVGVSAMRQPSISPCAWFPSWASGAVPLAGACRQSA